MVIAILDVVLDVVLDIDIVLDIVAVIVVVDDADEEIVVDVLNPSMPIPCFKFNGVVCCRPKTCNLFESALTMLNVPIVG